jgi:hypothetical protein
LIARRSIDQSKTVVNIPAAAAAFVSPLASDRPSAGLEIIREKPAFPVR